MNRRLPCNQSIIFASKNFSSTSQEECAKNPITKPPTQKPNATVVETGAFGKSSELIGKAKVENINTLNTALIKQNRFIRIHISAQES